MLLKQILLELFNFINKNIFEFGEGHKLTLKYLKKIKNMNLQLWRTLEASQ